MSIFSVPMGHVRYVAAGLLLSGASIAFASGGKPTDDAPFGTPSDSVVKSIVAGLEESRPDLNYIDIQNTPIPGLYQVRIASGPLIFTGPDGKHFVMGELFAAEAGNWLNLSEKALERERARLIKEVEKQDAIVYKAKKRTKAVVHVFMDTECGFCRRLHDNMDDYNALGIEFRYLAFPRAGMESETAQQMVAAWCSKNPQKALDDLFKQKRLEPSSCSVDTVAQQYNLGNIMGVRGTPSMITESGQLLGGWMPPEDLAKALGISE